MGKNGRGEVGSRKLEVSSQQSEANFNLPKLVQAPSPFDFYRVLELNIAIQRGIQGDSGGFGI